MALRIPIIRPDRPAHHRATCEEVLELLSKRCGTLVDREALHAACDGDPALVRYARDTLALFAQLGQVEHVRRDLWLIDPVGPPGSTERADEFLRAAVASRIIGPWTVIAGAWALVLHGVLRTAPGMRFALTPRPHRLATHAQHGRRSRDELGGADTGPPNADRHVTVVLGVAVAAVTRAAPRVGQVQWLEWTGHGAHVLSVSHALVSMLEHPRLSGGFASAQAAALPVLASVGIEAVVEAALHHPKLAVRRRVAFLIGDAVRRTEGMTSWFGVDEFGVSRDVEQLWRVRRALLLQPQARPTLLDPHRLPIGRRVQEVNVIDNRAVPLAMPPTGVGGTPIRVQVAHAREQQRLDRQRIDAEEWERIEQRADERLRRWLGGADRQREAVHR